TTHTHTLAHTHTHTHTSSSPPHASSLLSYEYCSAVPPSSSSDSFFLSHPLSAHQTVHSSSLLFFSHSPSPPLSVHINLYLTPLLSLSLSLPFSLSLSLNSLTLIH